MNNLEKIMKKRHTPNKTMDMQSSSILPESGIALDSLRTCQLNKAGLRKKRLFLESKDTESTIAVSAYKSLRTSVLKEISRLQVNSFMVTGPVKGVGKTSTAVNLAINIARLQSKKALLVDLDLRHPNVHKCLGLKPEFGVGDVLSGSAALDETLLFTGVSDFYVLPGKVNYENSSELLTSNNMSHLLDQINSLHKDMVVVFDMPPVLGCDDVPAVSPIMKACLMVIEEGRTTRVELDEAVGKIRDVEIIGYVLNKSSDLSAAKYYY